MKVFRSLGACVHINAALLGFGASNDQRKLYSVKPSVAMSASDFPDMNWEDEGDDDVEGEGDEDSDEV